MSGYAYFPGCSLRATGDAYEESLLELFRVLGLTLEELEDWNCCGATSYMSMDEGAAFLLSARNLSIAGHQGYPALCKGCGACVAACPSGSMRQNLFEDEQVFEEIEGVLIHA